MFYQLNWIRISLFLANIWIVCCHGLTSPLSHNFPMRPRMLLKLRGGGSSSIPISKNYDIIIIGGGSGGNACAKEAAERGQSVAVLDYVKPSPKGTKWGLGGTCVNVGCIPKKLMHEASRIGFDIQKSANAYGWKPKIKDNNIINKHSQLNLKNSNEFNDIDIFDNDDIDNEDNENSKHEQINWYHNWPKLINTVQDHIHSINFKSENILRKKNIDYYNDHGEFINNKQIKLLKLNKYITGKNIVIAVGGRPNQLNIPGGDLAITSDDLFSLPSLLPSKTSSTSTSSPPPTPRILVIGGSYVALECAGFLTGLGAQVTVLHRSSLLNGFDQTCAHLVGSHMEEQGTRFISKSEPISIQLYKDYIKENPLEFERDENTSSSKYRGDDEDDDVEGVNVIQNDNDSRLVVTWKANTSNDVDNDNSDVNGSGVFDLVLSAVGRTADIKQLGLDKTNVLINKKTQKVITMKKANKDHQAQSSVSNIYAIGDVVEDSPQLTPVAVKVGQSLAKHLANEKNEIIPVDYSMVSTTIFTPLEFSTCGFSEEDAIKKYGRDNIDIYHNSFEPLEHAPLYLIHKNVYGYCKAIVLKNTKEKKSKNKDNGKDNGKVIGLHYVGPHAGEVMQGFSVAMKMGLLINDLINTIGIHPTSAENMVKLKHHINKSSNNNNKNNNDDDKHDDDSMRSTSSPPEIGNC